MLARTFWPGPLTLIVKASDEVPEAFRSSTDTIGLRMPNNACALELIDAVGCPLATTSANVSGKRPAGSFGDLDAGLCSQVSAVLSDGEDGAKSGIASTVVDCTQRCHHHRGHQVTFVGLPVRARGFPAILRDDGKIALA